MKKQTKKSDLDLYSEEVPIHDDHVGAQRNLSGAINIIVDTFKLEPARMQKNVGYNERIMIKDFEHCHIYHTYDSSGKRLKGTNQVGGHYHEIKIRVDEETGNLIGECSPPMQNKRSERIYSNDQHTHEVTYIKSEKIKTRKMNPAAAQAHANFLKPSKSAPVMDVER